MSEIAPKRHCCKCGSQNITLQYNEEEDALDCKCEECGYKWQATTHEHNERLLAEQVAQTKQAQLDAAKEAPVRIEQTARERFDAS